MVRKITRLDSNVEFVRQHTPIDGYPIICSVGGHLWWSYRREERGRTLPCDLHNTGVGSV